MGVFKGSYGVLKDFKNFYGTLSGFHKGSCDA